MKTLQIVRKLGRLSTLIWQAFVYVCQVMYRQIIHVADFLSIRLLFSHSILNFTKTMAITYKVTKCRNPRNPDVDYYTGKAVKTGEYTFSDLARDINNSTTITEADATAVLKAMKHFITKALLKGEVVVLNDLGRL